MRHGEIFIIVSQRYCNIVLSVLSWRKRVSHKESLFWIKHHKSSFSRIFFFCLWFRGFFYTDQYNEGPTCGLSCSPGQVLSEELVPCGGAAGSGWHLHKPYSAETGWFLLWGSVGQILILDIKVHIFGTCTGEVVRSFYSVEADKTEKEGHVFNIIVLFCI